MFLSVIPPPDEPELGQARNASGGACIRCGCSIVHYCRTAAGHDGEGQPPVFLLCPDCLALLGTGDTPPEVLHRIREKPVMLQKGFRDANLMVAPEGKLPDVSLPFGARATHTFCPLTLGGRPMFSFSMRISYGWPFLFSLGLGTEEGGFEMLVEDNAWIAPDGHWRFHRTGNRYAITHAFAPTRMLFTYKDGREIAIEELFSVVNGRNLAIDSTGATLNGSPFTIPSTHDRVIGYQI